MSRSGEVTVVDACWLYGCCICAEMLRNLSNYFQLLWIIFCNQLKWERLELLDKLWEQSLNEIQFIRPHEGWYTKKSEWQISNIHHSVGVTGSSFDFLLLFVCSTAELLNTWWQKMSPSRLSWHHAAFIDHEITAYILAHSFSSQQLHELQNISVTWPVLPTKRWTLNLIIT